MLLMPQRRKMVSLILEGLGGGRPKDGPRASFVQQMGEPSRTGDYEVPDTREYAQSQCMQKFVDCCERKDHRGMAQALMEFLDMRESGDYEEHL